MRASIVVAAVLATLLTACTSEPLELSRRTIPVPDGTPTIEYEAVPLEQRTETLLLERDVVLTEAFGQPLYKPRDVDVASDGRIFVFDNGNHRVVVYDDNGTPLYAFGQEGQGPGEFKGGGHLCLTSDRVVLYDSGNQRLNIFQLDGELASDHVLPVRFSFNDMKGAGTQLVFIDRPGRMVPPIPIPWVVRRYSLEGEPLSKIIELETGEQTYWETEDAIGFVPMREPWPVAAFSRDGVMYASSGDRYQVVAFNADGFASWALRVDYEAPAPTRAEKDAAIQFVIDGLTLNTEPLLERHFVWPDQYAAIEGLEVDGQGNFYVFPHAPVSISSLTDRMETTEPVPVDVYSPEGRHLFSGMIPIGSWDSARGDFLYRVETDLDTEERVVARYRLLEPF